MSTETAIRPWFRDYHNVVALCRWLSEERRFTTEEIIAVMEEPRRWTSEWGQFLVEQEKTVEQD